MQKLALTVALAIVAASAVGCGSTIRTSNATGGLGPGAGPESGLTSQSGVLPGDQAGQSGQATGPGGASVGGQPGLGNPSSTTRTSAGGSGRASVPRSGPGWDERIVHIGVITQNDQNTAARTAGLNGLDGGDYEADAAAMVKELNARGGVFGRQVKVNFLDRHLLSSDYEADAQAACIHFTQDRPVVAVVNLSHAGTRPSFRACMAKARVPALETQGQALITKAGLSTVRPYFYHMVFPFYDDSALALVGGLGRGNYYHPWDTSRGAASAAGAAKLAIVVQDTPHGHRVDRALRNAFSRAGRSVAETFFYDSSNYSATSSSYSNAVLRFKAEGITHVVPTDTSTVAFMQAAESQNYRPRYAITSWLGPQALLEVTAPDAQLAGSMGVGWAPTLDTNPQNNRGDAAATPGESRCRAIMARGGQTFEGKRLAEKNAYAICDAFELLARGFSAGGGLTGLDLARGVGVVGPRFPVAISFASGLSATRPTAPGAVRDLRYVSNRGYMYNGPMRPM